MNFPILIIMEVVFAGLLAATTTRFNLQVVGANLPDCDQDELAFTLKQTTGFALIAGALSVQAGDNILQCGWHSFQTALWVTLIMSAVLLWQSLPTIIASACDAIDAAAEDVAAKGTNLAALTREQLVAAISAATQSISKTTTSPAAESEPAESSLSPTIASESSTKANQTPVSVSYVHRWLGSFRIASPSAEKTTVIRSLGTFLLDGSDRLFAASVVFFRGFSKKRWRANAMRYRSPLKQHHRTAIFLKLTKRKSAFQ